MSCTFATVKTGIAERGIGFQFAGHQKTLIRKVTNPGLFVLWFVAKLEGEAPHLPQKPRISDLLVIAAGNGAAALLGVRGTRVGVL